MPFDDSLCSTGFSHLTVAAAVIERAPSDIHDYTPTSLLKFEDLYERATRHAVLLNRSGTPS